MIEGKKLKESADTEGIIEDNKQICQQVDDFTSEVEVTCELNEEEKKVLELILELFDLKDEFIKFNKEDESTHKLNKGLLSVNKRTNTINYTQGESTLTLIEIGGVSLIKNNKRISFDKRWNLTFSEIDDYQGLILGLDQFRKNWEISFNEYKENRVGN